MKPKFDLLGLGCTAIDEILYVPSYPPPDGKVEVRARERHCGGLTATALVAAARLGARCAYAGTLGRDEESQFVLETLRREKVSVRHVKRQTRAGPVRSVIVVDESRGTRNIFYDVGRVVGATPDWPPAKLVTSTRVLLVDRFSIPGMIRAARMARSVGIPVVADFESWRLPGFKELLALADHLIVSSEFACHLTGAHSPDEAARKLWRKDRSAVIVTCGERGCYHFDGTGRSAARFPAFRVNAVDTTGCGDVFHGAYAVGLARGLELKERLTMASAAAAIKAQRRGGQSGIPNSTEVRRFIAGR